MITILLCFAFFACAQPRDHVGQVKTPSGSSILKGQAYLDVVDDLTEDGFTNIKTERIEDLITGWVTKDGEIEKVSIGGDFDYAPDKWVAADT